MIKYRLHGIKKKLIKRPNSPGSSRKSNSKQRSSPVAWWSMPFTFKLGVLIDGILDQPERGDSEKDNESVTRADQCSQVEPKNVPILIPKLTAKVAMGVQVGEGSCDPPRGCIPDI